MIFEQLTTLKFAPIPSPYVWFGLITGILLAFVLIWLRKNIQVALNQFLDSFRTIWKYFSVDPELQLKKEIYLFAQKQHIAASMFALDEIAIEPKVLTPYLYSSSYSNYSPTDSVSLTIPYTPDWPELGGIYNASTMPLVDALQGNANIILAGHSGSGKTVALAWLVSRLIQNDKRIGKLSGLLPLYIHAPNIQEILNVSVKNQIRNGTKFGEVSDGKHQPSSNEFRQTQVLNVFLKAISIYISPVIATRLPQLARNAIQKQRAILIIDKVDELTPAQASELTEYLRILMVQYPKLRMLVAVSFDNFAHLPDLSFSMLALTCWNAFDRNSLIEKWVTHWSKYIATKEKMHYKNLNANYLHSWLGNDNLFLNPLEYTLKIWASLCGDSIGMDGPSAIEAYIRRQTKGNLAIQEELEQIALQHLLGNDSNPPIKQVSSSIKDQTIETRTIVPDDNAIKSSRSSKDDETKSNQTYNSTLLNTNILSNLLDGNFSFIHPVIFGYLAGKALSEPNVISQINQQDSWTGKNLTLYYLSKFSDVSSLLQNNLQEDDTLHTNLLRMSRWLQVAPKKSPWRTTLLRALVTTLQKDYGSSCFAAKIVCALALAGDSGISTYFISLIKSDHSILKYLGALGCGVTREVNSVEILSTLLEERSSSLIRAASLALGAIGDKPSLELLANNLLTGDEAIRRFAAEALASNEKEGYPCLKDGSSMEDLLVRRSVTYGLIRVNQPWANKIVENLQLEDNEWVVRNAAIQVFDELNQKNSLSPNHLPELTETQWLINYASKMGTSVAPGLPALELARKALKNGTIDEKLNALEYFRNKFDQESIEVIYSIYKNEKDELCDAAYHTLWLMAASGLQLSIYKTD